MGNVKKGKLLSAGVSKSKKKAPMVDPKGAYTKVQQRTLGNMSRGGKLKKAQLGVTENIKKIANTKLSDVPKKAKNVANKAVNRVKNATVGDLADIVTQGGYTLAKDAYRRLSKSGKGMGKSSKKK